MGIILNTIQSLSRVIGMVLVCMQTSLIHFLELVVLKKFMKRYVKLLGQVVKEHISVHGDHNEQRLTGLHETASINDFSYGCF